MQGPSQNRMSGANFVLGDGVRPHRRGALRPSFASIAALERRGRRESRVRAAPAVSCANSHKNTHTSIQVQRRHPGFPCAMVLPAYSALSPVTGLSCHRRQPKVLLSANLTPASGCQVHTISPAASAPFVKGASASTASHRAFRDDREPPLLPGETGNMYG